jgi:WD40 repeat protein
MGRNLFTVALISACLCSLGTTGAHAQTSATGQARATDQPSATDQTREKAKAFVKQAEIAYEQGRYEECRSQCRKAVQLDPAYLRAYNWLGAASLKLDQDDAAIEAFLKVVKLAQEPENTDDVTYARNSLRDLNYGGVYVNDRFAAWSTPTFVKDKLVFLVPVRDIFQALRANIALDAATRTLTVKSGKTSLQLQVGSPWAQVNAARRQLEAPVQQREGIMLMPLRVVDALGAEVAWDRKQKRINIRVIPAQRQAVLSHRYTADSTPSPTLSPAPVTEPSSPSTEPTPKPAPTPKPNSTSLPDSSPQLDTTRQPDAAPDSALAGPTTYSITPRQTNSVGAIAYSPDGQLLATGNWRKDPRWGTIGEVKLWDDKGNLVGTLSGHSSAITALAFSPDGKTLVSGSWGGTLLLHDMTALQDETTKASQELLKEHQSPIVAIAFSPDGSQLISASEDGMVVLRDPQTGQPRQTRTLEGHTKKVRAFAFSWASNLIATSSDDQTVRLWHLDSGEQKQLVTDGPGVVVALALSPDGEVLAGANGPSVLLWNTDTATQLRALSGHNSDVSAVAFSADGNTVASGDRDGEIILGNVRTGAARPTAKRAHQLKITALTFGPSGNSLASGSDDGTVVRWK